MVETETIEWLKLKLSNGWNWNYGMLETENMECLKLKIWNAWNWKYGMLETEIKIFISLTLPNNYSKMRCFMYRCAFSLSYRGPCYRVRWRWWMECQLWWLDLDHVLNDPFAWWSRNCAWRSCLFFGSIFIAMPPSNLTDLSSYRRT